MQTSLIFDKIPLGIIVFDEANDIISINGWGEEFFEKTSDYLEQIIQEMVRTTWANHESIQKIIRFSDQNDLFIWNIKTEYIQLSSPQIAVIIQDQTINTKLEQTILKAEKLAVIGHLAIGSLMEIRNPLTSAIGFCQLIGDEDKIKKDYLGIISRELEQIQGIIENYTAISKPSTGRCIDSIYYRFWKCIHSQVRSYKLIMVSDVFDEIFINRLSEEQINNTLKFIKTVDIWEEEGTYLISFDINDASRIMQINFGPMSKVERRFYTARNSDKIIDRYNTDHSRMRVQIIKGEAININLTF